MKGRAEVARSPHTLVQIHLFFLWERVYTPLERVCRPSGRWGRPPFPTPTIRNDILFEQAEAEGYPIQFEQVAPNQGLMCARVGVMPGAPSKRGMHECPGATWAFDAGR